ncbi:uncharacterized protein LOC122365488 [Amphibalanus amphitrite]|uniref:uncharacterized protein LOC122365488 n=1 Tax=Amphibalanus amphitrite TaxID=1232801 RepID=UPI001C91801C|nr:uncharacterized protein LOC122365488 [Amphibalanus amphitrite]
MAGSGFKSTLPPGRQAEMGASGGFAPLDAEGRRLASDAVPLFAGLSNDFGEQKTVQRVADDQVLLEPDDQESSRTILELKNDRAAPAAPAPTAPPVTAPAAGAVVTPVPVCAAPPAVTSELRPQLPAVAASLPAHLTVTMSRYGYYGDFYKRPEPVRPAAAAQYDVTAQLAGRTAVASIHPFKFARVCPLGADSPDC